MEWLFFLVAIGISAYLYYFQRPFFDKHKGFIEFALILFTALFAIYQVRSSAEDFNEIVERMEGIITSAEESKKSLKEVEKSLAELPMQIDTFSISIRSLNDVVSQQRDKLEKTLEDFSGSIKGFQKSVDDMAQRFNRHPDLKVDFKYVKTDSSMLINTVVITNEGSLLATIFVIRFQIDEKSFISFELEGSHQTEQQANFLSFQYETGDMYVIPNKSKPRVVRCNIEIRNVPGAKAFVFVYYTSPFGNDGSAEGIIEYKK